MKTGKHRLWQTRIVEPPTLFHHEMLVEGAFQSYPVSVDADEDAGADAAPSEGNDVADDRKSAGYHHASPKHSLSHQGDAPAEEGG